MFEKEKKDMVFRSIKLNHNEILIDKFEEDSALGTQYQTGAFRLEEILESRKSERQIPLEFTTSINNLKGLVNKA